MPSHGEVRDGDRRERIVVAWLPVRCGGRWCWLRPYRLTERFEIDYGPWSTGFWLPVRRTAIDGRMPWGRLFPLWCLQDAVRRLLNRWCYCSLGDHRRDDFESPCKDCGR